MSWNDFHLAALITALSMAAVAARGDVPGNAPPGESAAIKREGVQFPAVMEHIRVAAESGEWKRESWSDAVIERALVEWVTQAAKLTGQPRPNLPAGVKRLNVAQARGGKESGVLYVGSGSPSFGFVDKSVILVDGNVNIGFAWDCVIVARGAVNISHGDRNVVIAGHYIHVSHDGNHKQGEMQGSLLMSGGVLNVSHARGSVCNAPQLVRISHANGATFIDSPNVDAGGGRDAPNKNVEGLNLPGAPLAARNLLEEKMKVVGAVKANDAGVGAMATVNHGGLERVVKMGEQITDEMGKGIGGLERWRLSFVGEDYVLFSTDKEDSGLLVEKP